MPLPLSSQSYPRDFFNLLSAIADGRAKLPIHLPFTSERAAKAFRFKFYGFRKALKAEQHPLAQASLSLSLTLSTSTSPLSTSPLKGSSEEGGNSSPITLIIDELVRREDNPLGDYLSSLPPSTSPSPTTSTSPAPDEDLADERREMDLALGQMEEREILRSAKGALSDAEDLISRFRDS